MKTVYIIIAFCAGLFLGHLLFPPEQNIKPPSLVVVQKTETKLNIIDSGLFAEKIHFFNENDTLKKKLQVANTLLSLHKSLLLNEQRKVAGLVKRIKQDTVLKADTLLTDSLYSEIAGLNANTDSIINNYEQKDSLMQKMVAIRDSQIAVCDESYREAKDLILEQEKREQQLTENLNIALKQLKRNRFQNKILAAGMLFVSGIAATLYIKSKP